MYVSSIGGLWNYFTLHEKPHPKILSATGSQVHLSSSINLKVLCIFNCQFNCALQCVSFGFHDEFHASNGIGCFETCLANIHHSVRTVQDGFQSVSLFFQVPSSIYRVGSPNNLQGLLPWTVAFTRIHSLRPFSTVAFQLGCCLSLLLAWCHTISFLLLSFFLQWVWLSCCLWCLCSVLCPLALLNLLISTFHHTSVMCSFFAMLYPWQEHVTELVFTKVYWWLYKPWKGAPSLCLFSKAFKIFSPVSSYRALGFLVELVVGFFQWLPISILQKIILLLYLLP